MINIFKEDVRDIKNEMGEISIRKELDINTFTKIVRRKKEICNAYFLDCLEKEKRTLEYAEHKANGIFKEFIDRMNSLQKEIKKTKEENREFMKPISFEKLCEWVKEEDTLSSLFVMPVAMKDIKRLLYEAEFRNIGVPRK